jgi:hypothetical protein
LNVSAGVELRGFFHGTIYSGTSHYLYYQQHRVSAEQEGSTPPATELTIERISKEFHQPSIPVFLAVSMQVKRQPSSEEDRADTMVTCFNE